MLETEREEEGREKRKTKRGPFAHEYAALTTRDNYGSIQLTLITIAEAASHDQLYPFRPEKKKYIMRYILKNVYHIRDVAKHAFHVLYTRKKKRYVQTFNVHGMKQFTVRMYNL